MQKKRTHESINTVCFSFLEGFLSGFSLVHFCLVIFLSLSLLLFLLPIKLRDIIKWHVRLINIRSRIIQHENIDCAMNQWNAILHFISWSKFNKTNIAYVQIKCKYIRNVCTWTCFGFNGKLQLNYIRLRVTIFFFSLNQMSMQCVQSIHVNSNK